MLQVDQAGLVDPIEMFPLQPGLILPQGGAIVILFAEDGVDDAAPALPFLLSSIHSSAILKLSNQIKKG